MVAVNEFSDPGRLTGDVAVMGAIADAGGDEFRAVLSERTGGGGDNPCLCGQAIESVGVFTGGEENIDTSGVYEIEFSLVPTSDGPAQALRSEMPTVFDGLAAGEAGGSV
jgi:hypothetical protein